MMTKEEFWSLPDNSARYAAWLTLPVSKQQEFRSEAGLTEQLKGLEGKRVEVVTTYGEKRRFWVGRSTGWIPCHLEVKRRDSTGGMGAERQYASVRVVNSGSRF